MGEFFTRFWSIIAELSLARKITMGTILLLTVGVIGYVVHVSRQASMEPLFTNLNSEDMGVIITTLDKQGTQYEVDQDKRTVMVSATEVLDIRMKLAQQGLPRFGGVGFELFDRGSFGMSEFEQRVTYQRALEGELTRTIGSIHEVESARVHLVLPEKSLFADSQQSATASVIVKLGSGQSLSTASVSAITHLVGSAVEGLRPDQVTVIDTTGRLLTVGGGDPGMVAGGQAMDQKMQIEKAYERRVVELLTPIVGLGKVVARVTAGVDFTRTENTDESIDPGKVAVLSEQRSAAKRQESAGSAGGAAGAAANLPGGAGGGSGGGSGNSDESTEQITYAVSKSVTRKTTPMGALQKLSIAILVDGKYEEKDGAKNYAPRASEEITQIEELVKSAVGFDTARGDQVKVQNMQFQSLDAQVEQAQEWYSQRSLFGFIGKVVANVLVVVMMLLVVLLVIRPLVQTWRAGQATIAGGGNQPMLEGNVSADVGQLVQQNPMAAANAIRQWLQG